PRVKVDVWVPRKPHNRFLPGWEAPGPRPAHCPTFPGRSVVPNASSGRSTVPLGRASPRQNRSVVVSPGKATVHRLLGGSTLFAALGALVVASATPASASPRTCGHARAWGADGARDAGPSPARG